MRGVCTKQCVNSRFASLHLQTCVSVNLTTRKYTTIEHTDLLNRPGFLSGYKQLTY